MNILFAFAHIPFSETRWQLPHPKRPDFISTLKQYTGIVFMMTAHYRYINFTISESKQVRYDYHLDSVVQNVMLPSCIITNVSNITSLFIHEVY